MKSALIVFIAIVIQVLNESCNNNEEKNAATLELKDIRQVETEASPPVANFDLSSLNIFILKTGDIYYYSEPGFKSENKFDEYRFEKLNTVFLHKTSFREARGLVSRLKSSNLLKDNTVWLAIEEYDETLKNRAFDEIIKPSGLSSATVGYITDELYTLLKTTR